MSTVPIKPIFSVCYFDNPLFGCPLFRWILISVFGISMKWLFSVHYFDRLRVGVRYFDDTQKLYR
jgi:hypothetical protein